MEGMSIMGVCVCVCTVYSRSCVNKNTLSIKWNAKICLFEDCVHSVVIYLFLEEHITNSLQSAKLDNSITYKTKCSNCKILLGFFPSLFSLLLIFHKGMVSCQVNHLEEPCHFSKSRICWAVYRAGCSKENGNHTRYSAKRSYCRELLKQVLVKALN